MGRLPALLYPVSYPKRHIRRYIAGFFDELHVLLPSEGRGEPGEMAGEDEPALITHVPLPLGERLSWFQSLVKDWQQWAHQLGLGPEGTDASVVEAASRMVEESIQSIMSSIKGGEEGDDYLDAQVFLELAYELDVREDELSGELQEISCREEGLKDLLAGPRVSEHGRQGRRPVRVEPVVQVAKRLCAWARLFARWRHRPGGLCPVGEGINARDYMDSAYEAMKRAPSYTLLSLDLSCEGCTPGERGTLKQLLASLTGLLPGCEDPASDPGVQEAAGRINELWYRGATPASGPSLVLTAYPGAGWQEVLARASRMDPSRFSPQGGDRCGFSFFLV